MKKSLGFTFIELLVVFSLIGILLAISLAAFGSTRKNARDGKRKADLETIRSALEMYRTDVGYYPYTGALVFTGTGSLKHGDDTYLAVIPNDPSPTYKYSYSRSSANSYVLCAFLEFGGDALSSCGSCGGSVCNYKVTNP